jgi:hypothetical protein
VGEHAKKPYFRHVDCSTDLAALRPFAVLAPELCPAKTFLLVHFRTFHLKEPNKTEAFNQLFKSNLEVLVF